MKSMVQCHYIEVTLKALHRPQGKGRDILQLQVHISGLGYHQDDTSLLSIASDILPVGSIGLKSSCGREVFEVASKASDKVGFEFCLTRGRFSTAPEIQTYGQLSRKFATGAMSDKQVESELLIQWSTFQSKLKEACGDTEKAAVISAADKILYHPKVRGILRFHAAKNDCTEVIYPFESLAGFDFKKLWSQRMYGRYHINGKALYFGPTFNRKLSVDGFKKQLEYLDHLENSKAVWDLDLSLFRDPKKIEQLRSIVASGRLA
jgi:hypothetical protein